MQKQRPIGVILFVIWSFIAGVLVILAGWDVFLDGKKGMDDAWGNPPDEFSQMWIPYFLAYFCVGIVWIAGGLISCVSAVTLFNGEEWGRKLSIITIIAISLGWIVIKCISFSFDHFSDPAPVIGIIIALPMLYLWTRPVREYCKGT